MKITVFGSGYVGLVTGACFAEAGHTVVCVDVDEAKISMLRQGQAPFYEPGLNDLVQRALQKKKLSFTSDPEFGVTFGDVIFIAVGTPFGQDGSADLTYVFDVAETIGLYISCPKVIVNKSTVPVGTAKLVSDRIAKQVAVRGLAVSYEVCSNPEFLKQGSAIGDFTNAARVVIGADTEFARATLRECYSGFGFADEQFLYMDIAAAELTKYAANAMLAMKVGFINEIANLAERLGADVNSVRQGIGTDPRIGFSFINPGCGYGGSCFPKDVEALSQIATKVAFDAPLIRAIGETNTAQKNILFEKLEALFSNSLRGYTVAVWGLAFKPGTDDMREAPSRTLIDRLVDTGNFVRGYDPVANATAKRIYEDSSSVRVCDTYVESIQGADVLVICTDWPQFRDVDLNWLRSELTYPVIVDGRNMFDPATLRSKGFRYYGIGRGDSINMHFTPIEKQGCLRHLDQSTTEKLAKNCTVAWSEP